MTSNIGTDVIQSMCEEEDVSFNDLKEAIYPQLREHFKPALVARMTVVPFFTLGEDILKSIARMKVAKVGKRLAAAHKMGFDVDDSVYDAIAAQCNQVDIGARQVDHLLDQKILPQLSRRLLEKMGEEQMPASVSMGADDAGEFTYTFSV